LIGTDQRRSGITLRRYPGGRILLRLPGASRVALRGREVAAVAGGGEHTDRVVVRGLDGRRRAARTFGGLVDALFWSPDGARLAVGWTDRALHSHLTLLTRRLKPLRTVDAPSAVRMSGAGWSRDGRTLTYATETERLSATHGPLPGQVRSLDVATGRQTVRFRGRCDALACQLVDDPVSAPGGRVAFLRDLTGVTLLRPGAAPRALALPAPCEEVDAVSWAGPALAAVYTDDGRRSKLALLHPGGRPRTLATLPGGLYGALLVNGRRAAVG
jgi:dipeptidyl aminopeptidase/acylaminoacyl peptidase